MDIDRSFIDKIEELGRPETVHIHGREYATHQLHLIQEEPIPEPLEVHTLTGLVGYLKEDRDDLTLADHITVHVINHKKVEVVESIDRNYGSRTIYMRANILGLFNEFNFGEWYDHESFLINLLSLFEDTPDKATVLELVGNMKSSAVKSMNDDGITQTVEARSGISFVADVEVPSPVILAPYRTFREINPQPASPFVFRVRDATNGNPPKCALFEADGSSWQLEAIDRIRAYLAEALEGTGVAIIA